MLNIYNNVVRYIYTEKNKCETGYINTNEGFITVQEKRGEAQLKSELNNYLFRGLIKLKKCCFMPLKNFTNTDLISRTFAP